MRSSKLVSEGLSPGRPSHGSRLRGNVYIKRGKIQISVGLQGLNAPFVPSCAPPAVPCCGYCLLPLAMFRVGSYQSPAGTTGHRAHHSSHHYDLPTIAGCADDSAIYMSVLLSLCFAHMNSPSRLENDIDRSVWPLPARPRPTRRPSDSIPQDRTALYRSARMPSNNRNRGLSPRTTFPSRQIHMLRVTTSTTPASIAAVSWATRRTHSRLPSCIIE
jgi:hypothetical protein